MTALIEILRADFWAAAVVFAVTLAALAYLVVITLEGNIGGDQ